MNEEPPSGSKGIVKEPPGKSEPPSGSTGGSPSVVLRYISWRGTGVVRLAAVSALSSHLYR